MANLLETIRNNSAALGTQKQGVQDNTQQVATLLRAKSGKAGSAPDSAISNLQETAAVDQTNNTIQNQVAPAQAIQQAGIEQQAKSATETAGIQKAELNQSRTFNEVENRLNTTKLLNQFEQNKGQLDLDKNKSQVQQFAQGLRLSNDKYISDLQREGSKARLDNEVKFNEALQNEAFDYDTQLQKQLFENEDIAKMSDRDFEKKLAQMGIDSAWTAFRSNQKANAEKSKYQAIGSLVSAGIGAAGSMSGGSGAGSAPVTPGSSASDYTSLGSGNGASANDYTKLGG